MIGGKVLDSSFVAAFVRGDLAAAAWLDTARTLTMALYVPALALTEVRAVLPGAGSPVAELLGHASVLVGELDAATAAQVDRLLVATGTFDALAGQVVIAARTRGWPVLSADPGRLRRIDVDVPIDEL